MDAKQIVNDKNGKPSSKRISGFILISVGLVFLLSIGISSIFKVIADPQTALSVGQTIIGLGGALIGVGVFESIGSNNNG